VKHARLYQELVRQELEMEPDAEIESLALAISNEAAAISPVWRYTLRQRCRHFLLLTYQRRRPHRVSTER